MPRVPTVRGRIVGRRAELDRLDRALDELGRGGSQLLQLVGEPGVGKTRLLAALLERAHGRGQLGLSGRASEFEHDVPLAPWIDALGDHVTGVAERERDGLAAEHRKLGVVVPELDADEERLDPLLPSERYQLHRAFGALLEQLGRERPLVVALDDLHWADSASIGVALHLVERPPAAPVLLALAYRPRQLPTGLARALEDIGGRGGTRLELAP